MSLLSLQNIIPKLSYKLIWPTKVKTYWNGKFNDKIIRVGLIDVTKPFDITVYPEKYVNFTTKLLIFIF